MSFNDNEDWQDADVDWQDIEDSRVIEDDECEVDDIEDTASIELQSVTNENGSAAADRWY